MPKPAVLLDAAAVQRALARMAHEIAEKNHVAGDLVLIGVQRRGVHLAARLATILQTIFNQPIATGALDVAMHRDDLHHRAAPEIYPTAIPMDVTGKIVVLVDDVLFSGRTTRAALDALNDFGRPKAIQLAVLVDRGHRELPIRADFVGRNIPTSRGERVSVKLREEGGEDLVCLERT